MKPQKGDRNKVFRRKRILWGFVICILAAIVIVRAAAVIERYLIDMEPVNSGVLEESIQVQALVYANGKKLVSPTTGKVRYLVSDGVRVPVGKAIAEVTAAGADMDGERKVYAIKAPIAGIVNLSVNTPSVLLNTGVVSQMSLEKLLSLEITTGQEAEGVKKGEAVASIVNNLKPVFLATELTPEFYPALKVGDKIKVIGAGPEETAAVRRLEVIPGRRLVLLEAPADIAGGNTRVMLVLKGRRYRGFIVPETALVKNEAGEGVYIARAGKLRWVPVEVVGRLNGKVAVDGLEANMRVARNAGEILSNN